MKTISKKKQKIENRNLISGIFVLMFSVFFLALFSIPAQAQTTSMVLNRYYDIEQDNVSITLTNEMDFQCTKTQGFAGADAAEIRPVNNARMIDLYNSSTNRTQFLNLQWSNRTTRLKETGTQGNKYIPFVTNEGNYVNLKSFFSNFGDCQIQNIIDDTPISEISSTPFLVESETYLPVKAQNFSNMNSKGFFYSTIDGGVQFSNQTAQSGLSFPTGMRWYYDIGNSLITPSSSFNLLPNYIQLISYDYTQGTYYNYLESSLNCYGLISSGISSYNFTSLNQPTGYISPACMYKRQLQNVPLFNLTNDVSTESLKALLHLEEDGSTFPTFIDSSGNNNHGVCVFGDCTEQTQGLFNSYGSSNAQRWNNTAYRVIGLSNYTTTVKNLTVSIWAKPLYNSYVPDYKNIMITKNTGWLLWQTADDRPQVWIWDQTTALQTLQGTSNVTGDWHNLLFTINTSDEGLRLYVDGVLENEITMGGYTEVYDNSEAVYMGLMGGYDQLYEGYIDEVAIWERVLTQDEINKLQLHRNVLAVSEISGGSAITQITNPTPTTYRYNVSTALYNMSQYNILYGVYHTPTNPQANQNVTVNWFTTTNSDSTVYFRYRNATDNTSSFSGWISLSQNDSVTTHSLIINSQYILDNKFYQYYVTSGTLSNTNNGNYYNFTVGTAGIIIDPNAALPSAIDSLESSGICSGSSCWWILGSILTVIIVVIGVYIGGVDMGLLFGVTALTGFSLIGILPVWLLIPIIVYIALFIAKKFGLLGGGD